MIFENPRLSQSEMKVTQSETELTVVLTPLCNVAPLGGINLGRLNSFIGSVLPECARYFAIMIVSFCTISKDVKAKANQSSVAPSWCLKTKHMLLFKNLHMFGSIPTKTYSEREGEAHGNAKLPSQIACKGQGTSRNSNLRL